MPDKPVKQKLLFLNLPKKDGTFKDYLLTPQRLEWWKRAFHEWWQRKGHRLARSPEMWWERRKPKNPGK